MLGREGAFFREFLMSEVVASIDGLSRLQLAALVERLGLQVCSSHPRSPLGVSTCDQILATPAGMACWGPALSCDQQVDPVHTHWQAVTH